MLVHDHRLLDYLPQLAKLNGCLATIRPPTPLATARWGGRRRLPRSGGWHGEATGGSSVETGRPPLPNGLVQMLNGPIWPVFNTRRETTRAQNHHRGLLWAQNLFCTEFWSSFVCRQSLLANVFPAASIPAVGKEKCSVICFY
jgi:hypothetical protein